MGSQLGSSNSQYHVVSTVVRYCVIISLSSNDNVVTVAFTSSVCLTPPVTMSQTLMVPSPDVDATSLLSETATALTQLL